jgi:fumarate reductase subunit D
MLAQRRMNGQPVMKGGAKEHIMDIVKKYAQPLNVYVGILLVLGIIYVRQIPKIIAFRANTFLGRLFLFALTIIIADTYSWIYALLMALFTVLIIAVAPRTLKEAFQDKSSGDVDVKLVTQKKKWWSEEILEENPLGIEDDKVKTSAIQDSGNTSSSTTSSK